VAFLSSTIKAKTGIAASQIIDEEEEDNSPGSFGHLF
jgi:hypothetical protein